MELDLILGYLVKTENFSASLNELKTAVESSGVYAVLTKKSSQDFKDRYLKDFLNDSLSTLKSEGFVDYDEKDLMLTRKGKLNLAGLSLETIYYSILPKDCLETAKKMIPFMPDNKSDLILELIEKGSIAESAIIKTGQRLKDHDRFINQLIENGIVSKKIEDSNISDEQLDMLLKEKYSQ